jgi:hypothetical protein
MIVSNVGTPVSAVRKLTIFQIQQKSSCMGEDCACFLARHGVFLLATWT